MQSIAELRIHPVDLSEFGATPSGEELYRVVWSDSRKSIAYRGDRKIVTDKYQHGAESGLSGKWILEKWLSAAAYYGMTADQWDALQRNALEQNKYSPDQQREIGKFLDTLPAELRKKMESQLAATKPEPIIEPYSHEGDYEFAGLYFAKNVDEAFLRNQIRGHIYRLTHTTDAERKVQSEAAEVKQEIENNHKFNELFDETREAVLRA